MEEEFFSLSRPSSPFSRGVNPRKNFRVDKMFVREPATRLFGEIETRKEGD